ncbi:DUF1028 domain-containing protein [Pseudooceanicola sp. CBS1P-1]|uniref:DUF1028 domain-containing protein n=1 Tax=Pseudooceanicola albus TaxID=2692189 RepID=A0A6L7G634_9RHOB|nr:MULTISPECIES: DUF1028 domain-containing protein [Pseudooceanicola]MBT9385351.1 DUF1028 domain-containing protein [Pseudooceanicola endophyticus]MXN18790.1 DUF1028 domain-containing protein [Pseudooceanicola albus]
MTFSIVARCAQTGQFGMAISSSSPAVAARCAFARAGVGAASSQNITNPALGPMMLDAIATGATAPEAVARARDADGYADFRQLIAIDGAGRTAIHSGARALGIWTSAEGTDCASGGNLLANDQIPATMVKAFETATGSLGDRLIAAMQAGMAAGGEAGPVHSAGLLVVDKQAWPYAELRIDWLDDACPIEALARAWEVYRPQADDYVTRALNPGDAPSYGVPGDE